MNISDTNYTTGVHAGSLWKLGNDAHLYLTNDHGSCNPLDNPQFKKAFENAKTIAVSNFQDKAFESEGVFSLSSQEMRDEQAFIDFETGDLSRMAEITKKHLPLEEIEKLNTKLMKFPLYSHRLVDDYKNEDPYKMFVVRLLRRLAYMILPQKDVNQLIENVLIEEAKKFSKNIISLSSKIEIELKMLSAFMNLFEIPYFFVLLKTFLFPMDQIEDVKINSEETGKAWDLGAISPSIQIPFCSNERADALENQFKKKINCTENETNKILNTIVKLGEWERTISANNLADKITALLEQEKDVLILQQDTGYKDLFSALATKKIEPIGPMREDLNPRGFLFEIKKVDTVVGYFLGSIHVTPNWVLENINSKMREAFESCNVLGVEVDITREDVLEGLKKEEAFTIPEEHVSLFKEVVSIGLKDIGAELEEADDEAYIKKGLELVSKGLQNHFGIDSGIDLEFIGKAKKRTIEIVDLESIETHREFMNLLKTEKMDFTSQISQMKDVKAEELYIRFKNSIVKDICERLPLILETGYIKALESFQQNDSKDMKVAMYSRNMEMAMTTHKLIRSGKKPFSIAGAAHFAGDKSMLKMMQDLGYTVTQVICEEPRGT